MKEGRRIKVVSGDQTAGFVLPDPPFPEVGETVRFQDRDWICTSSEPEQIIIHIPVPGKVTHCSVTLLDGRKGSGTSMKAAIENAKGKKPRKPKQKRIESGVVYDFTEGK
jgi:hypothetical protein